MSEQPGATGTKGDGQQQTGNTGTTGQQSDSADKPLGPNGEKALKAERTRAEVAEKAASEARAKLDEIEKANLSEVERAKREAEEAKTALATAQADALRSRIQAKHSISDDDADLFLTGSDEATLTRQAERLAGRAEDRKKNGNRAPLQGRTTNQTGNDEPLRELTRTLFKSG